MTTAEPGNAGYEEALRRVASIIRQNQEDLAEIDRMSEVSFRLWLDKVVQEISAAIGIALGKARAFVEDVMTTMANAGTTFRHSFRDSYQRNRQIERRR